MNSSLKQVLTSSIVALSIATGLQADLQQREHCKRSERDCFAFAFPKDMNLVNPSDIYFYVTGLAIQASEGGLEWGVHNKNAVGATPINGKVLNFDWNYNPGVRVGYGGYFDHDAWNFEANWTWVHFSNYQNVTVNTGNIIPMWLYGSDISSSSVGASANAGWRGHYNVVDTWLGKPYYVSRYFIMNPVMGLRLAFIDQDYDVGYSGASNTNRANVDIKNNFWGLGLRAGLNMDLVIAKNWKFLSTFAGSLLRGHFAVNQYYSLPTITTPMNGANISEHFWDTVPELELTLGIQWGRFFNCNRNYVSVRAAYEFYEWFNQFQARKVYTLGSVSNGLGNEALRSNFTLNGFSLALQFDF